MVELSGARKDALDKIWELRWRPPMNALFVLPLEGDLIQGPSFETSK